MFVREYCDLTRELSKEQQELFGQMYRVQKLTEEEINIVKSEIFHIFDTKKVKSFTFF